MNRYQELMDAMEPSEGCKNRLARNVLSYVPKKKKVYRPRTTVQTLMLIILLTFALVLTASAAYMVIKWDPIFLKRFLPTESQVSQLSNAIESNTVLSQCGGVTLKVCQTLGDDRTIYVILDITLPDSVPLKELIDTDSSGEPEMNIMPETVRFGSKAAAYRDIAGKSFEEADADLMDHTGSTLRIETEAVDLNTNTLTYLICYSPKWETVSGKPLTILIDKMVQMTSTETTTILEGPFLISWTPEYGAVSHTYEIKEGTYTVGAVTISPFSLKGYLYSSNYDSFEDFFQSISLTFKDGKTYMPQHEGCAGGFSQSSGAVNFDTQFTHVLLLNEVVSMNVGGYTIKID